MLTVLLLLSCVSLAYADALACPNGSISFDPPTNTNDSIWYPKPFSTDIPVFPANFKCDYQINVPQGWYAQIQLTVVSSSLSTAPAQVIDQSGRSEGVFNTSQEYFYFIASGGKIKLSTQSSQLSFGFSVIWKQYAATKPYKLTVSRSYPQPTTMELNINRPILITASTQVSATIIQPVPNYPLQDLRRVIFLDGSNPKTSKSIGNAYQLLSASTQFVSSGSTMSVVVLGVLDAKINPPLLFQDYANMQGVKNFKATECDSCFFLPGLPGFHNGCVQWDDCVPDL